MRAKPAEQGADGGERGDVTGRKSVQDEVAAVKQYQFADRCGQEQYSGVDQRGRQQAAASTLQRAEILERPPDEGVGSADEAGDFDFGGPHLASALAGTGLIDEYQLDLHPVTVGQGRSFFVDGAPSLKLARHETIGNAVRLTYVPT